MIHKKTPALKSLTYTALTLRGGASHHTTDTDSAVSRKSFQGLSTGPRPISTQRSLWHSSRSTPHRHTQTRAKVRRRDTIHGIHTISKYRYINSTVTAQQALWFLIGDQCPPDCTHDRRDRTALLYFRAFSTQQYHGRRGHRWRARYCYGDSFSDTYRDLECDKCDECVQSPASTFGCEEWCNEVR